jgi:osmoprotectant transport system permease protein
VRTRLYRSSMRWRLHTNPVSLVLSLAALAAALGLPFLRVAANRLVSGEPVFLWTMLDGPARAWVMLLLALLVLMVLSSLWQATKAVLWLQAVMALALIGGALVLAGMHASQVAPTLPPYARTSLGGAWWTLVVLMSLTVQHAVQRLQLASIALTGLLLASVMAIGGSLLSGACNDLSIMKEAANQSDVLWTAAARHVLIVSLALLPTLLIGVPLGWWAYRTQAARQALFAVLNVVQTIPSIALFGLLMAPLALLAAQFPVLAQAGMSGVGLLPGVIALTLYALLPVARGALAGLEQVPSSARHAALGMGMSHAQVFTQVELPLALPVLLTGVRTAAVQAVGLASVTALIGAGGLGAIMFEGLFSGAQDLVLLGVLPIALLAALTDAFFKLLVRLARPVHT